MIEEEVKRSEKDILSPHIHKHTHTHTLTHKHTHTLKAERDKVNCVNLRGRAGVTPIEYPHMSKMSAHSLKLLRRIISRNYRGDIDIAQLRINLRENVNKMKKT